MTVESSLSTSFHHAQVASQANGADLNNSNEIGVSHERDAVQTKLSSAGVIGFARLRNTRERRPTQKPFAMARRGGNVGCALLLEPACAQTKSKHSDSEQESHPTCTGIEALVA